MRNPIVRRPQQRRLTFDRRDLWQTVPDPDRGQCRELVEQLLRAVLQAEAATKSEDEREDAREESDRSSRRAESVYRRPSTLQHVRHREGRPRPYRLADRAGHWASLKWS